jgi:hypothetical protein
MFEAFFLVVIATLANAFTAAFFLIALTAVACRTRFSLPRAVRGLTVRSDLFGGCAALVQGLLALPMAYMLLFRVNVSARGSGERGGGGAGLDSQRPRDDDDDTRMPVLSAGGGFPLLTLVLTTLGAVVAVGLPVAAVESLVYGRPVFPVRGLGFRFRVGSLSPAAELSLWCAVRV